MKTIYPYDPDANLASNRVTAEVDVNLYPNKYNVVVPETAPFYRLDLEVRDSNDRLLIEGLDYYLGYYSKEISEATGKPVYGGIMLFDAKQASVKMRTVGGNHMIPQSEIARFLTKPDLEEPRNVNWSELQRYPTAVTPVDKPDSLEEALEKDVVVKALDGVRQNILKKIGDLDAKYKDVIAAISLVANKIGDHDLWTHHKTPHEHKYTRAMLNSLGVDETAVDAIKAYGLTLQEVVDEMVTFGINSARIDNLLNDTLNRTVKGRLNVSSADDLILQHESGNAKITLDGALFSMETTAGEIVFETDTDANEAGIGLEIGAGYNVLLVPSAGGVKGGYPSFNGKILITVDNILNFLHKPSQATANVQSTSSETVEFRGRGVDTSPFQADAIPPHATVSVSGLWKVSDSLLMTGDGYGISQWAVSQIRDALAGYVPKTFTVNGVDFGEDEIITLTKNHIGLANAQNTSPYEKPVTTALTNATKNKSLSNHTHNKSDLTGIPYADHDTEGLAALHNTIDNTINKAATPKIGNDLKVLIDDVEDDVAGRVKAGAASATHYGGDDYLPVPAQGNYGGYADTRGSLHTFAIFEKGRIVVLRNGGDGFPGSEGVYYWYADVTPSGLLNVVSTSLRYHPKFLDVKYPGYEVEYIVMSCPEALIFTGVNRETNTRKSFLVMTNGIADMARHTVGCQVINGKYDHPYDDGVEYDFGFSYAWDKLAVDSGKVYTSRTVLHNLEHYAHLGYLQVSDIEDAEVLTFDARDLYGTDFNGKAWPRKTVFRLLERGSYHDTNPNNGSVSFSTDGSYWSGSRNTSHGPCRNAMVYAKNGKMRVRTESSIYLSNGFTSNWGGNWTTSYQVDLNTGLVTVDHNRFPMEISRNGVRWPNGDLQSVSPDTPGFAANQVANACYGQDNYIAYLSHSNIQRPPQLIVEKVADDYDFLEELRFDRFANRTSIFSGYTSGVHGSVTKSLCRGIQFLEGTDYIVNDINNGNAYICKYDPDGTYGYAPWGGYGPTNDRQRFSNDQYFKLARIPRICKGGGTYLNGAQFRNKGETLPYKYNAATKTVDTAKTITIVDAVWDAIIADMKTELASTSTPYDSDRVLSSYYTVTVYDVGGHNYINVDFQSCYARQDDKSGPKAKRWRSYVTKCTIGGTEAARTVTSIDTANRTYLIRTDENGSYTYVASHTPSGQNLLVETADGVWFSTCNLPRYGTVGGSGNINHYYRVKDGVVVQQSKAGFNVSYTESFMNYLKEQQKVIIGGFYGNGEFLGGTFYNVANPKDADGNGVVHGSKTAEGWIVYFTQDMPFYAEQSLHNVPKAEFDLTSLFPGSYANRTFYIHVDVSTGTPKYTIDEEKKPDTATRLWIGHVKTDSERIIELVAERARRLGSIATLIQHEHNKYAHGYDYSDTLLSSEYSLLENKGMVHDFNVVSFKDIFNTWYRFSHSASGTYPANANELNNWQYVEKYDCVECTINSGTFIGFISDEMAGDYVFNTVVSSYNGDDDGIFVMLGAFKQGDVDSKEHTLALQVNTGGFGTTTPYVCLIKDHAQAGAERIATLDPASDGSGANTGWMESNYYEVFHIWAKRVKNELLIYVDRKQLPTATASLADYELKVSNYVNSVRNLREADFEQRTYLKASVNLSERAPMFAKPTRFGYGAQSQHLARFWNIERPLSNLNEFYSSEQMLLESMAKNDDVYRKFSGQTLRSAVGDKHAGNNHAYLTWANAVVNQYAGSTSGNYARPHPTAQYISPTHVYNPPGNREFIVKKKLNIKTNSVRIVATADDELRAWIGNVAVGAVGSATQTTTTHSVIPGEQVFTFACKNVPANSPAHCAFAIYDGNELVAVSDTSWKCFDDAGHYDNVKVAEVSYLIENGTQDVFSVNAKTSAYGTTPREVTDPIYQTFNGKWKVKRYVDVTKGDVDWDVVMIKNPV